MIKFMVQFTISMVLILLAILIGSSGKLTADQQPLLAQFPELRPHLSEEGIENEAVDRWQVSYQGIAIAEIQTQSGTKRNWFKIDSKRWLDFFYGFHHYCVFDFSDETKVSYNSETFESSKVSLQSSLWDKKVFTLNRKIQTLRGLFKSEVGKINNELLLTSNTVVATPLQLGLFKLLTQQKDHSAASETIELITESIEPLLVTIETNWSYQNGKTTLRLKKEGHEIEISQISN